MTDFLSLTLDKFSDLRSNPKFNQEIFSKGFDSNSLKTFLDRAFCIFQKRLMEWYEVESQFREIDPEEIKQR